MLSVLIMKPKVVQCAPCVAVHSCLPQMQYGRSCKPPSMHAGQLHCGLADSQPALAWQRLPDNACLSASQGGARVKPGLQGSAASAQLATPSARATQSGIPRQVVFLPTCVNRMMGAARGDTEHNGSTLEVFTRLANKAGYQVIVPKVGGVGTQPGMLARLTLDQHLIGLGSVAASALACACVACRQLLVTLCQTAWQPVACCENEARDCSSSTYLDMSFCVPAATCWLPVAAQNVDKLCCGMMFDTRGAKRAAGLKVAESSTELVLASQMGKLPVGECLLCCWMCAHTCGV